MNLKNTLLGKLFAWLVYVFPMAKQNILPKDFEKSLASLKETTAELELETKDTITYLNKIMSVFEYDKDKSTGENVRAFINRLSEIPDTRSTTILMAMTKLVEFDSEKVMSEELSVIKDNLKVANAENVKLQKQLDELRSSQPKEIKAVEATYTKIIETLKAEKGKAAKVGGDNILKCDKLQKELTALKTENAQLKAEAANGKSVVKGSKENTLSTRKAHNATPEETVVKILALKAEGKTPAEISTVTKCSLATISRIVKRNEKK